MGYVAGIIYHDGGEWLLTKRGDWQDTRPDAPKERQAHVWATRAEAEQVARSAAGKFQVFTRGYIYSTPNPENARGLLALDRDDETTTQRVILN